MPPIPLTFDNTTLTNLGHIKVANLEPSLINGGVLNVSTAGNTVEYNEAGNQDIILPSTAYYNLILSGSGTKTLQAHTQIDGDFTLTGATFDPQSLQITLGGTTNQTLTGAIPFYDLVINNTAASNSISVTNDITISNSMTFTDGVVDATGVVHFLAGSSSNSGTADSYVDGPVKKSGTTAFIFPVGDGIYWARIGIGAPSSNSDFQAQYFATAYSNTTSLDVGLTNVSTVEYWTLDRPSGTGTATVTLYWEDASRSAIVDTGDLIVARWDGAKWVSQGGLFFIPNLVQSLGSVSTFSPFTFGSPLGNNPLPITLLYFTAEAMQDGVELKWATATETLNDYFTIERSKNGFDFYPVVDVEGKGTTQELNRYAAVDENPYGGLSYYRLKQTDFNGDFTYSKIVSVTREHSPEGVEVVAFPNPVYDQEFTVSVDGLNPEERIRVVMYDSYGRLQTSEAFNSDDTGHVTFTMNTLQDAATGVYPLVIQSEKGTFTTKILKR